MIYLLRPHHNSTLETLAQIGQTLSGFSFFVTAVVAVVTLIFVNRSRADAVWLDKFRNLYGEFWNDNHMKEARRLLANKEGYDQLSKILKKRNSSIGCDVEKEEYFVLEEMDNFFSVLIRARSFAVSTYMSDSQIELWGNLLFNYWINKINEREEMKVYVNIHWNALLKPFTLKKRKWYTLRY